MRLPIFAMAIGAFAIGTTEFVVMGILPIIAASENVSLANAGLLVAAYALGVVIGAPLLTITTTKINRKHLLIALMGAFALANLATALAPNYSTLLATRFLAGLPHGAFFGAAAVVGASLVPYERRARAIAAIMSGLTVATVVGVPLSAVIINYVAWQDIFLGVAVIALLCAVSIWAFVPDTSKTVAQSNPVAEIKAIWNPRIGLTLATGAVGFGGMFACYTYLTPMLEDITGMASIGVAITLVVFGLGMVIGNYIGGHVADKTPVKGLYFAFVSLAAVLIFMYLGMSTPILAVTGVLLMAITASMVGPILQRLLLDGAHEAPSLASSLHHSAFNTANANGAWLGGLAISAGFGIASPIIVGAGLALVGLGMAVLLSRALQRAPEGMAIPGVATVPVTAKAELVNAG